jgi:hypothetical protein
VTLELVRSPKFSTEEVDGALLTLAMLGGNTERAAKQLREAGLSVTARSLRAWREKLYPRRYEDICARHRNEIENVIVQRSREVALTADDLTMLALQKAREQLEAGECKDPAAVARNAATTKGINVDKALVMEGRPNQISEQRDAAELLRAIRQRVTVLDAEKGYIDGEAEELEAAS